jgi:hypothetical protein
VPIRREAPARPPSPVGHRKGGGDDQGMERSEHLADDDPIGPYTDAPSSAPSDTLIAEQVDDAMAGRSEGASSGIAR